MQPDSSSDVTEVFVRGGIPRLSAVIVSPGGFEGVIPAYDTLVHQTVAEKIELIVVTPRPESFEVPDTSYERLHSLRVMESGPYSNRGQAAASGVLAVRAPVVALVENHVYLDRRWAECMLESHEGLWTCVTPRIAIANPERLWARVSSFMDYGDWICREGGGETDRMPWHNATYKREPLVTCGDALRDMLEPESRLQERLREEGHRFLIDDRVTTRHLASSTARSSLLSALGYGRHFAIQRRGTWSVARRFVYALAWPVFPFIRLFKLRGDLKDFHRQYRIEPLLPGIFSLLVASSFGECLGYLGGMGRSEAFLLKHDLYLRYRLHPEECHDIMNRHPVGERAGQQQ